MAEKNKFITNGDGFADVTLSRPFNVDGTKVTTLRVREPLVADQLAMDNVDGGAAAKEITMLASLCDLPPQALHTMSARDYKRLQDAYMGFLD